MVKTSPISKPDRAFLLMVRVFLIMSFTSYFGHGIFGNESSTRMLEEDNKKIDLLFLAMPYFTFIPLMAVLSSILENRQKHIPKIYQT